MQLQLMSKLHLWRGLIYKMSTAAEQVCTSLQLSIQDSSSGLAVSSRTAACASAQSSTSSTFPAAAGESNPASCPCVLSAQHL